LPLKSSVNEGPLRMHDDKTEKWMELCERASKEQDSVKLIELIEEISRLLGEKGDVLNKGIVSQE
jgi:hypothetical protein